MSLFFFLVEYGSLPRVPNGLFCCGRAFQHPPAQVVPASASPRVSMPLQNVDPADIARNFTQPLIESAYEVSASSARPPLTRQNVLPTFGPEIQVVPVGDSESENSPALIENRPISPRPSTSRAPFW
jgi:hypothetical protein